MRLVSSVRLLLHFNTRSHFRIQPTSRLFSTTQSPATPPPLSPYALLNQITSFWVPYSISAVMKLNIPQILQDKGPQSIQSLASLTNSSSQHLCRLLRSLKSVGFFTETSNGNWENNANSTALNSVRPFIDFTFHLLAPVYAKLTEGVQNGKTQFSNLTQSNGLEFWDWLQKYPNEAKVFGDAMTAITNLDLSILSYQYPWEKFNGAKIMDVGGGFGKFF